MLPVSKHKALLSLCCFKMTGKHSMQAATPIVDPDRQELALYYLPFDLGCWPEQCEHCAALV